MLFAETSKLLYGFFANTFTSPELSRIKPANIFSKVVFPAPLRPISQ